MATVLLVSTAEAPLKADSECNAYASACANQCGTTVSWSYVYTQTVGQCIWVPPAPPYWFEGFWIPCYYDIYNYSLGSGIELFECAEVDPSASICMCRY